MIDMILGASIIFLALASLNTSKKMCIFRQQMIDLCKIQSSVAKQVSSIVDEVKVMTGLVRHVKASETEPPAPKPETKP